MKLTKILLCAAMAGAMAAAANKASAFPLKLTSLSGTLTVTTNYSALSGAEKATVLKKSFTLKNVLTVITNTVFINSGTTPPSGSYVAYEPFTGTTYLTNNNGYFYDLGTNEIAEIGEDDIATGFKTSNTTETESDVTTAYLDVEGTGPDGLEYEIDIYGKGSIAATVTRKTGKATATISGSGTDFGRYQGSSDGVAEGSFELKGTGIPEWEGPYSVYWWNNLD
jgi:hypothetical protein